MNSVIVTPHALQRAYQRLGRAIPRGVLMERWLEWEIAAAFAGGHVTSKPPTWAIQSQRNDEGRLFVKLHTSPKCCLVIARRGGRNSTAPIVLVTVLLPATMRYSAAAQ